MIKGFINSRTSFVARHDESCGREPMLASCAQTKVPFGVHEVAKIR